MILYLLSFVKFNLVVFQDILIYFVIQSHLYKWKRGWVEYIRVWWPLPSDGIVREIYDGERIHVPQPANPSIASLCHCLISVCHLALLQCSGNVFFGMFQLTATFTKLKSFKGEIKRFLPLRSEFKKPVFSYNNWWHLWFRGTEEVHLLAGREKKCTQGMIHLQFLLNTGDRKCLS